MLTAAQRTPLSPSRDVFLPQQSNAIGSKRYTLILYSLGSFAESGAYP